MENDFDIAMAKKEDDDNIVNTEMDEFVRNFHTHPDANKMLIKLVEGEDNNAADCLTMPEVKQVEAVKGEIALDHEAPIGKGLFGAQQWLKNRGEFKETIEKKGRIISTYEEKKRKFEINLERRDKYGKVMTQKEAFRVFSHGFHGVKPGKKKQEKRIKRRFNELKLQNMNNS